jgi:hypothetical protein
MRIYSDDQERSVRSQRLVGEWMRSGLIDAAQREKMDAGLRIDLRRTNRFLRLTLFGFGLLIVGAFVGLLFVTFDVDDAEPAAALSLAVAATCIVLAEFLIRRFRLYHFGIEEACAVGAAILVGAAGGILASSSSGNGALIAALTSGTVAGLGVYWRYGYVYGAIGAMVCAGVLPFSFNLPDLGRRLFAAAVFAAWVAVSRDKRRRYGDEFPGDEYAVIHALAWVGCYATLNLQLFEPFNRPAVGWFYWSTFTAVWIVPAAGLWMSLRDRDRLLLDASLLLALMTLVTSKSYLGLTHEPWDPIVLGLVLIGSAVAVRRWLAHSGNESRRGLTATRILRSDTDALATAAIASVPYGAAPAAAHPEAPAPDPFDGGRSGGGGGGASF